MVTEDHPTREPDLASEIAVLRKLVAKSLELLRTSPDTFMGRKTQEPFPSDEG